MTYRTREQSSWYLFEKIVLLTSVAIIGICSIMLGSQASELRRKPSSDESSVISRFDADLTQVCEVTSGKLVLTAEVQDRERVTHGRELAQTAASMIEIYEKPDKTLELHWNEGANCRALCLPSGDQVSLKKLSSKASRIEWRCHSLDAPLISTFAELQWVDLPEKYRNHQQGRPAPKGYLLWRFKAPTQPTVTLRALNGFRFNERVWRRPWSVDVSLKPSGKPSG